MSNAHKRVPAAPEIGDEPAVLSLILPLYRDIGTATPWSAFLDALCRAVRADAATLVLRQPALGDRGLLFDVRTVTPLVELYRSACIADDPFNGLPEALACSLADRIAPSDLRRTAYYGRLLKPDGITDMLAMNIRFGVGYVGALRIARRDRERPFVRQEKALLEALHPYVATALTIDERGRRQQIENLAYARALDQLAFGVVILNDRGDVVKINGVAERVIARGSALRIEAQRLRGSDDATDRALDEAIAANLADVDPGPSARWLEIAKGGSALHILLKPIGDWVGGPGATSGRPLGVALFFAADGAQRRFGIATCASFHHLSRAEVALLEELVDGGSILSASGVLGISESTARTQLRSIFAKTGTHRQADLIRLVLTSLAVIA